jgi:hypothetical protein
MTRWLSEIERVDLKTVRARPRDLVLRIDLEGEIPRLAIFSRCSSGWRLKGAVEGERAQHRPIPARLAPARRGTTETRSRVRRRSSSMVPSSSMYYDAPICWRERHDAWSDEQRGHLFSYLSPEQRVPVVHPLRTIRAMSDDVLRRLSPRFDANRRLLSQVAFPKSFVTDRPHWTMSATGWLIHCSRRQNSIITLMASRSFIAR